MRIKGFGVNTRRTDGNFSRLENQLTYLKEAGFEYLEVSADVVDIIGGGKIIPKRIDKLLQGGVLFHLKMFLKSLRIIRE